MLYLISTPIGNLKDITYRAVETLSSSDYILCEDTTHSLPLLKAYHIQKPLYSYHKFNEATQIEKIVEDLKKGLNISLISDAGTPGICDPGQRLVLRCMEENLSYTVLPGPCAVIAALTLSGCGEERFQFIGFLPKKESDCAHVLQEAIHYPGTTLCYETPHRLLKTLKILIDINKEIPLCIARELTKIYEECRRGSAEELFAHYTAHPPRGEIVLLIPPYVAKTDYSHLSILEHVKLLEESLGIPSKEAIKLAASLRGVSKREIYNTIHKPQD